MSTRISIGIVNFNGGLYLRKCVLSALGQGKVPVNVFVYDNASVDSSLDTIADLENVVCLKGNENRGYAYACNRLIESMKSEFVAVANMDLEFDSSWAAEVCAAFDAHRDVDSVASIILEQGDPITVNFAGIGFFPDLHSQSIYAGAKLEDVPQNPSPIFGAYGAVMVFRKSLFEKIGFFDEDYFLFYEETEFYWRMNIYGRKTIYWPNARVLHYRSLTTRRFSPLKLYYTERNRIYTGLKILPIRCFIGLYVWSIYRLMLARRKVDTVQKERMRETGASPIRIIITIAKAWLSVLVKLPIIMKKRRTLWDNSGANPHQTIEVLKQYRIPWKFLSMR